MDESVHMLEWDGASILDLASEPHSGIPSSFLLSDASRTLLVGHIKSTDEQLLRAAEVGIAAAGRILDQRHACAASIGISR
jgi:hypothetical protein